MTSATRRQTASGQRLPSGDAAPEIVALDVWFQVDETDRVLLHAGERFYVVVCDTDGPARIFEADAEGQLAGWIPVTAGASLEEALEQLATLQDLPSPELISAVVQVRVDQRLRRDRLARGRPAPTAPGLIPSCLVGNASLRPGPLLHMGRTSNTASTPGKPAELALDFAPEVSVGPSTDVRPTTTLDPYASAHRRRFVTTFADTR